MGRFDGSLGSEELCGFASSHDVVCVEERPCGVGCADDDQRIVCEMVDEDRYSAAAEFIRYAAAVDDIVHGHGLLDGAEVSEIALRGASVRKHVVESVVLPGGGRHVTGQSAKPTVAGWLADF